MDAIGSHEQPVVMPGSLDQIEEEPNPERRARAGVDFAAIAERNAEVSFFRGGAENVIGELNAMTKGLEIARDSLIASGKTPGKNPELYIYAERRSRQVLKRLEHFEQRMFVEDRSVVAVPKARVREIHDFWLDGIKGGKVGIQ
jgi:phage terminase large subunit